MVLEILCSLKQSIFWKVAGGVRVRSVTLYLQDSLKILSELAPIILFDCFLNQVLLTRLCVTILGFIF